MSLLLVDMALAQAFSAMFSVYVFQRLHDVCRIPMSLFHRQSADVIPLPYNVAMCRKTLYQLLLTLLMSSLPQKPSPDQVLVKTFSLGISDHDLEVFLSENYVVLSVAKFCIVCI